MEQNKKKSIMTGLGRTFKESFLKTPFYIFIPCVTDDDGSLMQYSDFV